MKRKNEHIAIASFSMAVFFLFAVLIWWAKNTLL